MRNTGFLLDRPCGHRAGSAQRFIGTGRAVLRCGQGGYSLRVEKYEQWLDIEVMYHPERTILR